MTVVVPLQPPWLAVADTKATLAGSGSVTVTSVASLGPRFVTTSVYVSFWPARTGSGESVFWIARSASGEPPPPATTPATALSFDVFGSNSVSAVFRARVHVRPVRRHGRGDRERRGGAVRERADRPDARPGVVRSPGAGVARHEREARAAARPSRRRSWRAKGPR